MYTCALSENLQVGQYDITGKGDLRASDKVKVYPVARERQDRLYEDYTNNLIPYLFSYVKY